MPRCTYRTRDGSPCNAAATGSNNGCYAHDPDYQLARLRNAKKGGQRGGRGRSTPGTIDLQRLQRRFEALANQVLDGNVDRGDAAVVAQLLNGARACILASAKVQETVEFEDRLQALERRRGQGA
jgi:hypothetical protein